MKWVLVTKNQKGSLAVQFLFGWVLIMIFGVIFGALSLTLMMSEVVQFITYVSARNYFLDTRSKSDSIAIATAKYNHLIGKVNLLKTGTSSDSWFSVQASIAPGLNKSIIPSSRYSNTNLFVGVWTAFSAKGLFSAIPIPLWGGAGGGGGGSHSPLASDDPTKNFSVTIGSYLGREPSQEDCQAFNAIKWKWISELPPRPTAIRFQPAQVEGDNGC